MIVPNSIFQFNYRTVFLCNTENPDTNKKAIARNKTFEWKKAMHLIEDKMYNPKKVSTENGNFIHLWPREGIK